MPNWYFSIKKDMLTCLIVEYFEFITIFHSVIISFTTKHKAWNMKFAALFHEKVIFGIFVSTPLEGWGGGGTIYSNGFFFVQSILADRYNNRRELWVVSLKSCSSVEYGNKKIIWSSVFYRELSSLKLLWILDVFQLFHSDFDQIFVNLDQIFVNFA